MTTTIELSLAQSRLAELVAEVARGAEVILTVGNAPRARLVAVSGPTAERIAGLHPGSMTTAEDFDGPLPEEFWAGSS